MSTMTQLREGVSRAWESLTIGWRELRELAGDALTRFQPRTVRSEIESPEDRLVRQGSRWGLLAAEIVDEPDAIHVLMEIPGLESEDIVIEAHDNVLIVRGEKKLTRETSHGHYVMMERAYGHFERAVSLPSRVTDSGASASYRQGVLSVMLPKINAATRHRIAIQDS